VYQEVIKCIYRRCTFHFIVLESVPSLCSYVPEYLLQNIRRVTIQYYHECEASFLDKAMQLITTQMPNVTHFEILLGYHFSAVRRNLTDLYLAPLLRLQDLKLQNVKARVLFDDGDFTIGPNGPSDNITS
jgi:hypothetical protein